MHRPGDNIVPLSSQGRSSAESFRAEHRRELLTILFTDLANSTQLQSDLGNLEAALLTDMHRQLVRETLARFEAREIEWAGDSCLAVFAKPSDGVSFALRLQAALRRARINEPRTPHVRIGLHVGEIVVRHHEDGSKRDDLFGLQVSEAARVMSLARADQIYCTRSVFDNARSALRNESIDGVGAVAWRNYGLFELKGSDEPAEICEVGEEGLAPLLPPVTNDKCMPIKGDIEKWRRRRARGVEQRRRLPIWVLAPVGVFGILLGIAIDRVTTSLLGAQPGNLEPISQSAQQAIVRFSVAVPNDSFATPPPVVISPSGTMLAFPGSTSRSDAPIYVRPLDGFNDATRQLQGTTGGDGIAFSTDGKSLFVAQNRKLLKYNLTTGASETIVPEFPWFPRGGAWGNSGSIVVGSQDGLVYLSDPGSAPVLLTRTDRAKGETFHSGPQWLPNEKAILFTNWINGKESDSKLCVVSVESKEIETVHTGGVGYRFTPTGHLIYGLTGKLWAVAFDTELRKITGTPIAVADGIATYTGAGSFAIAPNGVLAYVSSLSELQARQSELVQIDHNGAPHPLNLPVSDFVFPDISPDGRQLAVAVGPRGNAQLWLYDLERGSGFPLIPGNGTMPIWSPEGDWIAYRTETGLFRIRTLPNSDPVPILTAHDARPSSWTPDGKELIFTAAVAPKLTIRAVHVDGETKESRPLVETAGDAFLGRVSPDGRWLAYTTDASGRPEVWVRPFADSTGTKPLLVSSQGGRDAMWSRDGAKLFFLNSDASEMLGVVTAEELSNWGLAERICPLDRRFYIPALSVPSYDVTPDGRFVFARYRTERTSTEIRIVLNWFEELKRLVPIRETN